MPKRLTPKAFDLLAEDTPAPLPLDAWLAAAHTGAGTPWLLASDADALARFALRRGEGVSLMEAAARAFREPPRDIGWEILGSDSPGDNWDDHRNPHRAYALFRAKLDKAHADGVVLLYKLWLAPGG